LGWSLLELPPSRPRPTSRTGRCRGCTWASLRCHDDAVLDGVSADRASDAPGRA